MANNNYPQITSVTSEALQAQIRTLLPSQEGFGTDLMAQNVIVPIIDLTAVAEGTNVPEILTTALAFGSQTAFNNYNNSSTVANTAGFWRIVGTVTSKAASSGTLKAAIQLSDGLSTKDVWAMQTVNASTNEFTNASQFDLVIFLDSGESLITNSAAFGVYIAGSVRQIADSNGNLINPSGFSPQ